jgi:hypothetical protein
MTPVVERELTLASVHHPEYIDNTWQRVDHPTVRPLTEGAPDLGWEGDSRLVVYLHKRAQTFVLWRLESDGEYRPLGHFGIGGEISPASINETIRSLIRSDSRRGFDPYESVVVAQEAVTRDQERVYRDRLEAFADRLLYGLSRSHLPGVDISRIRQLPSRR